MRVQETNHVQNSHNQLAKLVTCQKACWNGKKINQIPANMLGIAWYAGAVRVMAGVYGTFWLVREAVTLVPRLSMLSASVISNSSLSLSTLKRITSLCALSLKTTVLQGASFVAAMTLPEFFYSQIQAQKLFFLHHMEVFIETLPDFPEVYTPTYESLGINLFESYSKMWLDFGLTNADWRQALKLELCKRAKENPELTAELVDPTSNAFRKAFISVLSSNISKEIVKLSNTQGLTANTLKNLDSKTFIWLYSSLPAQTVSQVLALRSDLNFELSVDDAVLFEALTGNKFRSPDTLQLGRLLLEAMKQARVELIRDQIFTSNEIEEMQGSLFAIIYRAIYSFVSGATINSQRPEELVFRVEQNVIILKNDDAFFKSRASLVKLHNAIKELTPEQNRALLQRIARNDGISDDSSVQNCFNMIAGLQIELVAPLMLNEKLREEDRIEWMDAFMPNE